MRKEKREVGDEVFCFSFRGSRACSFQYLSLSLSVQTEYLRCLIRLERKRRRIRAAWLGERRGCDDDDGERVSAAFLQSIFPRLESKRGPSSYITVFFFFSRELRIEIEEIICCVPVTKRQSVCATSWGARERARERKKRGALSFFFLSSLFFLVARRRFTRAIFFLPIFFFARSLRREGEHQAAAAALSRLQHH